MNQVDFFIIVVVAASAISGARRGMISSAGDIISLLFGLVLASLAYPLGAAFLERVFGLSSASAGPLGFILLAVFAVFFASWGFSLLSHRFELSRTASRLGGAAFGAVFGTIFAAVLILASGVLPGAAAPVSKSALGPRITVLVPHLHENMEAIGIPLPKLVRLPTDYRDELQGLNQGLQFLRFNFSRLDGATCLNCRSPVQFTGYHFSRGTLMSPKFGCPNCGRTSDGCQTFEGFHAIYGQCPITLAEEGIQFDCGVWTNGWWVVPHRPCPVCGTKLPSATDPTSPQLPAREPVPYLAPSAPQP